MRITKDENKREGLSRRDFARVSTLAAASVTLLPRAMAQSGAGTPVPAPPPEQGPKLSPAAQAEAEAKVQNILRKYGERLSDAQRADIRKSVMQTQDSLEKLRAFHLENSDEPALVLHLSAGEGA
jgi:hypothetical protein